MAGVSMVESKPVLIDLRQPRAVLAKTPLIPGRLTGATQRGRHPPFCARDGLMVMAKGLPLEHKHVRLGNPLSP